MKRALLFVLLGLCGPAEAQRAASVSPVSSTSDAPPSLVQATTNLNASVRRVEAIRAECIQSRRRIAGKILKILPDGLVIDSGYTNLSRAGLNGSWLLPGTTIAAREEHLIEASQPGALCVGLVFLTDLPKTPRARPHLYDFVNLEAFPCGEYTFESVGTVRRPARKFTTKIARAIEFRLEQLAPEGTRAK